MRIGIILSLINLACRHTVTKHFLDVAHGHGDRLVHLGGGVEIGPILEMVAISSLVVHPRKRISKQLPLPLVGTAAALIVARPRKKLGGRIFGKVMKQTLEANPRPKAVRDHAVAVSGDGPKVQKCLILDKITPLDTIIQ